MSELLSMMRIPVKSPVQKTSNAATLNTFQRMNSSFPKCAITSRVAQFESSETWNAQLSLTITSIIFCLPKAATIVEQGSRFHSSFNSLIRLLTRFISDAMTSRNVGFTGGTKLIIAPHRSIAICSAPAKAEQTSAALRS